MDLDVKNLLSTNPSFLLMRLIEQYQKQECLIVAYDFDDTVSPYWCAGCTQVQSILRRLRDNISAYFIVYTCNKDHDKIKKFLDKNDIPYDSINENAPFAPQIEGKLFYNVFLDDKAGLGEVVNTLDQFLYLVNNGAISKEPKSDCKIIVSREDTETAVFTAENVTWGPAFEKIIKAAEKARTEELTQKGVEIMREIQEGKSHWINSDGKAPYICGSCGGASSKNYTTCPQCKKEMTNGDCAYTNKSSVIKELSGKPFICVHDGLVSRVEVFSYWSWRFGIYKCENCGDYTKKPLSKCPHCGATMRNGIKH